jgi:protein SCO1/2
MKQLGSIRLTVALLVGFMVLLVAGFVYRITLPQPISRAELQIEGLYLHETPRSFGEVSLLDHHGEPFTRERFEGTWSLVFFGFTYCPDICPATMAFMDQFVAALDAETAGDTQVVMVSVDPARDSVEQLATYVPYFNEDFLGVTGDFLDIHRFATALNTPFRKLPGQGDDYLVDHSANVVLINPRGDYHGFFKAPLDQAKMVHTYRQARMLWDKPL